MKKFLVFLFICFFFISSVNAAIITDRFYTISTSDGTINSTSGSWNIRHDAATGLVESNVGHFIRAECFTTDYCVIYRGGVAFDTSSIPDNAIIQDASINLFITGVKDDYSDDILSSAVIVQGVGETLESNDFNDFGAVNNPEEWSDRFKWSDYSVGEYNTIALNTTGISGISTYGWSSFGMRTGYDVDDVRPETPGSVWMGFRFDIVYSEDDINKAPYLEVTYTVPIQNNSPVFDPIDNKAGQEGQLMEFQLTASDPDPDDIITFNAENLPTGASLDQNTGLFSWVPGYDQAGNYEVEFTVTDDGNPLGLDVEIITITIGNVNRLPIFTPVGSQAVDEGELLEFSVIATDPDSGDVVIITAANLPDGANFNQISGQFSWTPGYLQEGTYTVTFTATDNGTPIESSEMGVPITVGNTPNPTELTDDLVDDIINSDLSNEVINSYLANLKKVTKFIDQGKITPALNQLYAFICKVEEDFGLGEINETTAAYYINWAEAIIIDLDADPADRICN